MLSWLLMAYFWPNCAMALPHLRVTTVTPESHEEIVLDVTKVLTECVWDWSRVEATPLLGIRQWAWPTAVLSSCMSGSCRDYVVSLLGDTKFVVPFADINDYPECASPMVDLECLEGAVAVRVTDVSPEFVSAYAAASISFCQRSQRMPTGDWHCNGQGHRFRCLTWSRRTGRILRVDDRRVRAYTGQESQIAKTRQVVVAEQYKIPEEFSFDPTSFRIAANRTLVACGEASRHATAILEIAGSPIRRASRPDLGGGRGQKVR